MSPPPIRGPRGRVLLFGGGAIGSDLAQRWHNAIRCEDPFEVLARVVGASARDPVVAIAIGTGTAADAATDRLLESIVAIDPGVDVVRWIDASTATTLADHTTDCAVDSADALHAELVKRLGWPAEALESETMTTSPENHETWNAPSPPPTPPAPAMPATLETPPPTVPTADLPVETVPLVETMPQARSPLGDLDLVEAVMLGGDRLRATALDLLRERLDSKDLKILPAEPPPAHRGASSVEIRDGETRLGWLASASVPAAALAPWAAWLGTWMRLDRAHTELRRQAMTDELTGVGNRRAFERILADTLADARRQRRPVTLMVFDIDNFKTYNDQHGHEAGDEVLRETVQLLGSTVRRGDHVFRIGGDEFVVIFCDPDGPRSVDTTPIDSVEDVVRRFQAQVPKLRLPALGPDAPGTVTVSAGLATYPWDGIEPGTLLAHADKLALKSKREGKNRITFGPGAREYLERR